MGKPSRARGGIALKVPRPADVELARRIVANGSLAYSRISEILDRHEDNPTSTLDGLLADLEVRTSAELIRVIQAVAIGVGIHVGATELAAGASR